MFLALRILLYNLIEFLLQQNQALAIKSPHLLDFHEDITSLEAASKVSVS